MKYKIHKAVEDMSTSRPARGEWIEITREADLNSFAKVSPREGRVD